MPITALPVFNNVFFNNVLKTKTVTYDLAVEKASILHFRVSISDKAIFDDG